MTSSTDLVLRVIDLLGSLNLPYLLVGSYSSNFYGRPRLTHDADFVVEMQPEHLGLLREGLGSEFHVDPQMSFEAITLTRRYLVVHTATAFKIELFLFADEPFNRSRFSRRRQVDFEGHITWLPTAEDVIVQKLRWSKAPGRGQDLVDAANVLKIQRPLGLDEAYMRKWCDHFGTRELFERLLTEAR